MSATTITPQELHDLRRSGKAVDLIDVRTPVEFREAHIEGALLVPLDALDPPMMARLAGAAAGPLYLICRSGGRGRQACERFVAAGFPDVINVEGGVLAWEQAGLPLVRGKKVVSLERQVRIVAGSLVLLGAVLAWAVHPLFVLLSAWVGIGLVFAGVTDRCGMGLLLARMPWNRVRGPRGAGCSR